MRPLNWLITVGLRSIGLGCGRTIHFRPIWFRTAGFRSSVWLDHRRSVRFRLVVRLSGPSDVVFRMRSGWIGCWLNSGMLDWRVIRRSHRFRWYDCAVAKCARLRSRGNCRFAMIHGSPLLRVRARGLRMLGLNGYSRNMFLARRDLLLRPWTHVDPTIAAVVADSVHRGAVDHRGVVNVVNDGDVHVVHRTVVEKVSVLPTSTFIALAVVTIAVTDSAIETYVRTPVALIEDVSVAAPAPVGWSPQETDFRSHDPCAGHPVVTLVPEAEGPI